MEQEAEIIAIAPFWLMPFMRFVKFKLIINGVEEPTFEVKNGN